MRWLRNHGPFTVCLLLTVALLVVNVVLLIQGRWLPGMAAYAATWCAYNGMRATVGLRPWSISVDEEQA